MAYAKPIRTLITELGVLPGVGPKTAQRYAIYIMKRMDTGAVARLANAMMAVKNKIQQCIICGNLSEGDHCDICQSTRRDRSIICVVESPQDINAMEEGGFKGLFQVLHGCLSPMDGIGPEEINISSLIKRVQMRDGDDVVKEVVFAISGGVEQDTTVLYISQLLKPFGIRTTRLATGLPVGGDLDHADPVTLDRAMEGRVDV